MIKAGDKIQIIAKHLDDCCMERSYKIKDIRLIAITSHGIHYLKKRCMDWENTEYKEIESFIPMSSVINIYKDN